jgi:hypothetical protein
MTYARSSVRPSLREVQERSPAKEKGCTARAVMDPAARAQGPADTELRALGLVSGAGNPNSEPLHMRLKR